MLISWLQHVLELLQVAGQTLLTMSNADESSNAEQVSSDLRQLSDTYLRLLNVCRHRAALPRHVATAWQCRVRCLHRCA
jgi:hypothetical protein